MDKRAWRATVHAVAKSWTWLSNQHFQLIQVSAFQSFLVG